MNLFLRKGIAFLLALLMLVGILSACGGTKTPQAEDPTNSESQSQTPNESEEDLLDSNGYLKDSLPETYNFNEDFIIYSWQDQKAWEWVDPGTQVEGTVMQKLVERQLNVESRFGITIRMAYAKGAWDERSAFVATMANNIQSNSHAYDLVGQYTPAAGIAAMQGLYLNLYEVPYLDLAKPWWPSSITETCTVGDKLYFVTGDITPTLIRNVHCLFVNTDLFDAYSLKNLTGDNRDIYQVVEDGDWTMEMLTTLGTGQVGSMDGIPEESRIYGISFLNNVASDAFFFGAGFKLLENVDGVLSLSSGLTDNRLINLFDSVKRLFTGYYADAGIFGRSVFEESRAIFYGGNISDSQFFSENGLHFTILPQPKLDANQKDYYTISNFWVTMYSIPTDISNIEMSGMVLEGLASESYRNLKDDIYYNIFQIRYNVNMDGTGDKSARMFDIVSKSVVFDSSRFFADELAMFSVFRTGVNDVNDSSGSWATIYDGNKDLWKEKIQNIYEKVG